MLHNLQIEIDRLKARIAELERPLGNSAHPTEDRQIGKAIEESKNWRDPECFMGGFGFGSAAGYKLREEQDTRIRELLRRAKDYIPYCRINGEPERHTKDCKYPYTKCDCGLEETLTEIENEIL